MPRLFATAPRYLAISLFCFLFNNALLLLLAHGRLHYVLAVGLSFSILTPLSYGLHMAFTYRIARGWASFTRYVAAQAVNLPAAILLYFLLCNLGGISMFWATPLVTLTMFAWNFTSSFWAAYSRKVSSPPCDQPPS
ncbi:MAG: hypothetical protein RLY97_721 [Pseudomonadota bacterium]